MEDKIIISALAVKEKLLSLPEVIDYFKNKEQFENNEELKQLKKLIVRSKNEGRLADHKTLLDKYNNHPLVVNYNSSKEIVKDLLKEIKDILD